jgi:predicted metal-dependent hydrolase
MMAVERSQVHFGHTAIPYVVRRSQRRTTVSIAIDPAAGVLVTAPQATTIERLDRVVRGKARWIVTHTSQLPESVVAEREFVTGETFLYLGRQYRLHVRLGVKAWVALTAGRLSAEVPNRDSEFVRTALARWYRQRAGLRLPSRLAFWCEKLGVPQPAVLIRDQNRRWASCDPKGNLRFNWRIIQAPMRLVDYVVAHELVHLTHRHHTAAFWAMLGEVMPDYESRRQELRNTGARLEW